MDLAEIMKYKARRRKEIEDEKKKQKLLDQQMFNTTQNPTTKKRKLTAPDEFVNEDAHDTSTIRQPNVKRTHVQPKTQFLNREVQHFVEVNQQQHQFQDLSGLATNEEYAHYLQGNGEDYANQVLKISPFDESHSEDTITSFPVNFKEWSQTTNVQESTSQGELAHPNHQILLNLKAHTQQERIQAYEEDRDPTLLPPCELSNDGEWVQFEDTSQRSTSKHHDRQALALLNSFQLKDDRDSAIFTTQYMTTVEEMNNSENKFFQDEVENRILTEAIVHSTDQVNTQDATINSQEKFCPQQILQKTPTDSFVETNYDMNTHPGNEYGQHQISHKHMEAEVSPLPHPNELPRISENPDMGNGTIFKKETEECMKIFLQECSSMYIPRTETRFHADVLFYYKWSTQNQMEKKRRKMPTFC